MLDVGWCAVAVCRRDTSGPGCQVEHVGHECESWVVMDGDGECGGTAETSNHARSQPQRDRHSR